MYKQTTLSNGSRIVSHPMKDRQSAALGLWVGVGGRYEDDRLKGAAHFLEHILFKGSRKYSCSAIKEQIEGVGGSLNAFTTEEQTCYYAKIPARYLNRAFDILSDMVCEPKIPKAEVEKERTVIMEEIKMYQDLPQYYVLELLDRLVWPGHPLGKSLAGTMESVGAMSKKDLQGFHRGFYVPENIVVSVCGAIDHQSIVQRASRKMGRMAAGTPGNCTPVEPGQKAARVNLFKKPTEQMHLALGMPALKEGHKDKYALHLLHVLLGGNMSSRLFNEIREKRGLAYSIGTAVKTLQDTGLFMVRAGVDNRKLVPAVELILSELKRVTRKEVSGSEFSRAKEYLSGQVLLGLEDTMEHMLWMGESMISRNRIRTWEHVIKQIKKVKIADLQRVAAEIFRPEHYHLALIGPVTNEQDRLLRGLVCP